jgi:hypothetical protein
MILELVQLILDRAVECTCLTIVFAMAIGEVAMAIRRRGNDDIS